jgi:hypothetical protein
MRNLLCLAIDATAFTVVASLVLGTLYVLVKLEGF